MTADHLTCAAFAILLACGIAGLMLGIGRVARRMKSQRPAAEAANLRDGPNHRR